MNNNSVWLLGVLLLSLGAATATASTPEEPVRPLRVVTYNLLHGGPASGLMLDESQLDLRLDMAVRELQALEPDIIALQEVSHSRQYGDVATKLAGRLGLLVVSAFATDRLFGVWPLDTLIVGALGFNEGSAILSRFPIAASERYDLPRCQRFLDPRILLRAELSTPWGPLQVYSTHASRGGCQADRIGEIALAHRGEGPGLVMGDFNATEMSPGVISLREQSGFVDVFRTANPDLPGLTVWQRIEVPHPTVFRRVDYIFLVSGQQKTGAVRSSRLVLDRPGRLPDGAALWPSDHYGVFAEVEIIPVTQRQANR
jgi:endonuclease/exonuclease/phosphatase family metal-dependent hydrolase